MMARRSSKPTRKSAQNRLREQPPQAQELPFIAHIHELRKRCFFVAASVGIFAGIAYTLEEQLTAWLLSPAAGQQFIYTTPGGGFDFVFKLCLFSGLAASIPVIVYHLFRFIHPLFQEESQRFMLWCTMWSSALALVGILFGYFFGLPAAMHFLLQNFSGEQIKALITIQSYMSFVIVYLLGASLLFQLPLLLILINRIKPLSPRTLMRNQRWFIVGAFVVGAIMSPTPDIRNQFILSGPIILMYELSIGLIWVINRRRQKPRKVAELLKKDAEIQTERLANFEKAQAKWREDLPLQQTAVPLVQKPQPNTSAASSLGKASATMPSRPRRYLQEFTRHRPYALPRSQTS